MADERKCWRGGNVHEVVLRDMVGRGVMNEVGQESPKESVRDVASATRSRGAFPHWAQMWRLMRIIWLGKHRPFLIRVVPWYLSIRVETRPRATVLLGKARSADTFEIHL
jgi:hypothetical protein